MERLRALAWTSIALGALGVSACGAAPAAVAGPQHDAPVPASEPRAEIRLRVSLTPAEGCEEAFDLALYRDLGVDLIAWDERAGACAERIVTIRYLPRRIREAALLAAVRRLAREVVSLPAEHAASPPASAAPPRPGEPR